MSADAVSIVMVGITRNLPVSRCTRPCFSGLDEGPADASASKVRIDVPPLDKRNRRGLAARRVFPLVELQEPDHMPGHLGYKDDELSTRLREIPPCLDVVIRRRPRPQAFAHTKPCRPVALDNLPDRHRDLLVCRGRWAFVSARGGHVEPSREESGIDASHSTITRVTPDAVRRSGQPGRLGAPASNRPAARQSTAAPTRRQTRMDRTQTLSRSASP